MTTAVDTNIFSRIWQGDYETAQALQRCSDKGTILISPIVYTEMMANPSIGESELVEFLKQTGVRIDYRLGAEVWTNAGQRFAAYARRKNRSGSGEPRRLAADFVIGAHALLQADRLLTFDRKFYRVSYPELRLVDVETL